VLINFTIPTTPWNDTFECSKFDGQKLYGLGILHNCVYVINENGSYFRHVSVNLILVFIMHVILTTKKRKSGEKPADEKEQGQRASTLLCKFTDLSRLYVVEMEKRIGLCLQHHKPFF